MLIMEISGYFVVKLGKKIRYLEYLDNLFLGMKWEILKVQKENYEFQEDYQEIFFVVL